MKQQIFLLIAGTVCLTAVAQDSGWFASGAVGQVRAGFNNITGANIKTDTTVTTVATEIGYQFNRQLSLSAGYRDFGTMRIYRDTGSDQFAATLKGTAFTLGPTAHHALMEGVEINATAGVYRWTNEFNAPQGDGRSTHKGSKAYFGGGLSYALTQQTSIGARWTRFKSQDASLDDADVFDVVFKYRF